jgi:hypothetical protein
MVAQVFAADRRGGGDDVGVDGGVGATANLDVLLGGEGRRSGGQGHGRSGQNKQSLHDDQFRKGVGVQPPPDAFL